MNASTLPRLLFVFGLGSLLLAQTQSPARAVEDALPASTYAAVRFGGLQACADAAAAVPMSAVVDGFLARLPQQTRARYFDQGLDEASQKVQAALQRVGVAPADLRAVLGRPMVLAMGRLTIEGLGPSLALLIDAGDCQPAIDRLVAAVEGLAAQRGAPFDVAEVEVGGAKVKRAALRGEMPQILFGSVGGFFVVTNSRGYLGEIAEVLHGRQPKLAAASSLAACRAQLPQPALASAYLNTASLCAMLDAHLPYEAADLAKALGLGRLDGVYLGTSASPLGGCDALHVGIRGSVDGLCKAMVGKPVDLSFARLCSSNTVAFGAASLDVPAAVDAFRRLLEVLPAAIREELRRDMGRDLARELRQLGTSPQQADATLRAFGNQLAFAIGLEKGPVPKPELLVHVAVRDGARVQSLLQKLEAAIVREAKVEWKTRKVGETDVRFCNVELPDAEFQLSPCYALLGDGLLFGSDVQALVRALRQGEKPDESFAAQPDFQALAKECASTSGVLHLRLFRAAELGWRTVEQLGYPQLDNQREEVGFGSDALPDAQTLAAALGTSTLVYRVDETGILLRSHGTLGFGSLLAALGAAADEVLHRACGKIY
ncbi:MAG: hypothetical protein FJ265_01325 [Planctomycetes bacterium]|nr:hypothetical protein [Planctomycetota bacterium]